MTEMTDTDLLQSDSQVTVLLTASPYRPTHAGTDSTDGWVDTPDRYVFVSSVCNGNTAARLQQGLRG